MIPKLAYDLISNTYVVVFKVVETELGPIYHTTAPENPDYPRGHRLPDELVMLGGKDNDTKAN